jgi:quercetin dioxygenase-like cupin family protein
VPEAITGLEISRMQFDPGGRMVGVPHTSGTREYLTCERGQVELIVSGEHWLLKTGDMIVFRGDQRHSYHNPDTEHSSVALAVVCFASR